MGKKVVVMFLSLFIFVGGTAMAASFNLSWQAPTMNVDGTPLTDLAGYRVYYGIVPGNYSTPIDVGNVLTWNINLPPDILYYFAVTAYDTGGNESAFSNEASKIKFLDPAAPAGLQVQ